VAGIGNTSRVTRPRRFTPDRQRRGGELPNAHFIDIYLRKEEANQRAKADVMIGDEVLAKDVPATVLLGLETKLAALRAVYEAIPTLMPGPTWVRDTDAKLPGVWRSVHPDQRVKTRKTIEPVVLVAATREHPAQVEKVSVDKPIGKITIQTLSGMTTSAAKSETLGRLDRLIGAVKKARQRANGVEVNKALRIGDALMGYVNGELKG
jgi:hypothetical protein